MNDYIIWLKHPIKRFNSLTKWNKFSNIFYSITTLIFVIILVIYVSKGFINFGGFIVILLFTILCAFIHFPWINITRFPNNKSKNEETFKMELYTSSDLQSFQKAFRNYLIWGKKYRALRWIKTFCYLFVIIVFLLLFFLFFSISPSDESEIRTTEEAKYYQSSNTNLLYKNLVQPPICGAKVKGLDMIQAMVFAKLVYSSDDSMDTTVYDNMLLLGDLVSSQKETISANLTLECKKIKNKAQFCLYVLNNNKKFNEKCFKIDNGNCNNAMKENIKKLEQKDYKCSEIYDSKTELKYTCQSQTGEEDINNLTINFDWYPDAFPDRDFYGRYMKHFRIPSKNLSILSFRGTHTLTDVFTDIELWISSVIVRYFDYLFPFVISVSNENKAHIGVLTLFTQKIFRTSLIDRYIEDFSNYIDNFSFPIIKENNDDVLVIGHSLGGGLAKVIGIKYGFSVLSLSGGGVAVIQNKYKRKDIDYQLLSIIDVVPEKDLIPQVGFPTGSIYRVPCKDGIINCHNLKRTICQIVGSCGSNSIDLVNHCDEYLKRKFGYGISDLQKPINISETL